MSIKYNVYVEDFAKRHYIKKFNKKYGSHWLLTWESFLNLLSNFDEFKKKSQVSFISSNNNIEIYKIYIRIAGTKVSAKASGNRCIVMVNRLSNDIKVLLVYHKSDLGKINETATYKVIIKSNYKECRFM